MASWKKRASVVFRPHLSVGLAFRLTLWAIYTTVSKKVLMPNLIWSNQCSCACPHREIGDTHQFVQAPFIH